MFYCNFPFVQDPLLRVSFLRCVSRLSDILSRKQMARHSAKSKELVTFFGRRQQPFPLVTMYIYFAHQIWHKLCLSWKVCLNAVSCDKWDQAFSLNAATLSDRFLFPIYRFLIAFFQQELSM